MAINIEREKVYEHAEFSGLRNTVTPDRFGLDDLEVATNVDIDDAKQVSRRKGYGPLLVAGVFKSLWSDNKTALAVKDDTTLVQLQPTFAVTTLRTDLTPGLEMSYCAPVSAVYYSNGAETGVVQDGVNRTWGLTPPAAQPTASATGGNLPAGRYQYAVTYLRGDLQESGTPHAGVIELTAAGGIALSAIPVSSDPSVEGKVIYFTKHNGASLYRAGVIGAEDTTFSYQSEVTSTVTLRTQHLQPPPAGQIVDNYAGAYMLVARGDTLYRSEPYALELFDWRKRLPLGSPITMIAALESGVYVGTREHILWLAGDDPAKWSYEPLLSYGAIPGALSRCSRDMVLDGNGKGLVAVFATTQGICIGEDGGAVTNLTQDRFAYPIQERGAAVIRRHRGSVQGVFAFQGAETAGNTAA
jgi:hypothetical protein